ncbi:hypothetical protein BDP27DRAFT_1319186 [Rhodocollybia butyracea]|uniref:F-box domain-containing protein n=1 Tax=Rhodocollybia butyracea TaxID=206335 RepID=A0A9P5Q0K1_9AGAR|nr:hypothetical protein BDP27DRAFT_1319186 [Rhodocollybia butyracea]
MTPPSPPSRKKTEEDAEDEPEELRRFREEWKLEVKRQKEAALVNKDQDDDSGSTVYSESVHSESTGSTAYSGNTTPTNSFIRAPLSDYAPAPAAAKLPSSIHVSTVPPRQGSDSAVAIYREAVILEQRGELEEALFLYRSAFRREPNVDILYEREEMLGTILAQQFASGSSTTGELYDSHLPRPKVVLAGDGFTMDDLSRQMEKTLAAQDMKSHVGTRAEQGVIASRSLESVLSTFPQDLVFQPEDENEVSPFNLVPDEIIVSILKILDPSSLERFASVNRKARVVSLDIAIWIKLVNETYKPPQIPILPDGKSFLDYLSEQYLYDYRRLYIEHARVRLDGVYIAVCHYIRPGLSENSWVNVNHLITYHRYLRFFPNGQVISLLTNEEQPPAQVIPRLKLTLRGLKGLFFGNWHLSGNTVVLNNLIDASSRALTAIDFASPSSIATLLNPSTVSLHVTHGHGHGNHPPTNTDVLPSIRYIFTMNLTLRSRPLGRWNKMDIASYDSVNLETGDVSPVALKHERPFWFSKVRSYLA